MKNARYLRACAPYALAVAALAPTSVLAQNAAPASEVAAPAGTAPTSAAPVRAAGASDTDIVVTARRREENVQNVPVAITAFSQTTLQRRSISNAFDLNKAVPGLNVSADSGTGTLPTFSIRGRGNFYGASSGSVETYFADMPTSAPFQIPTLPPQFFDLQSVQVLKGPQGTLFGRNTTGGAVLFVPQAPTDEFGGYARLQGGTYDDLQFEAAVNLPFNDKVMLRVAGFEYHRKGYSRTIGGVVDAFGTLLPSQRFDNQDITEARATLLLKPTDRLTNSTIFTYHTDKNRGSPQAVLLRGATGAIPVTGSAASPRILNTDVNLDREPSNTWAIVNTTTYDLSDDITIKNIFGHINAAGLTNNPSDPDGTAAPGADVEPLPRLLHNYQTTDELQLQGHAFDQRISYIVGGLIDLTRQPGGDNDINVANNSLGAVNGVPAVFAETFRQSHYTSKSAFGSFTGKITDTISLTGGVRHTWDYVQERVGTESFPVPNIGDGPTAAAKFRTDAQKSQGWTYNANLEWHPSSKTMLYGGYRHGYKRGGFNQSQIGTGGVATPFGPEGVNDYYVGLKQDLAPLGIHGHFNIEGFYDIYHGAQRAHLGLLSLSPLILTTEILNAPKITYRGFDTDFVAEVTPWLELSGNYTFVDAFYGKYIDPTTNAITGATGGDLSVNPVGLVSKHKASVTARFHEELSNGSEIAFAPSISYQSRFYFTDNSVRQPNDAVSQVCSSCVGANYAAGYKLVDVRLEWNKFLGSKFDLAFNGNNLFNKTYKTGGGGIYLFGYEAVSFGPPRLFTVEAKVHF